ncbi:MAG: hypothetical protein QGI45_09315 [Myxococcota bacterium]|nr:hypothetical protein [Myxococcota bacterium]
MPPYLSRSRSIAPAKSAIRARHFRRQALQKAMQSYQEQSIWPELTLACVLAEQLQSLILSTSVKRSAP